MRGILNMFKKGKNIFSLLIIIASIFMTSSTNMVEAQDSGDSPEVSTVADTGENSEDTQASEATTNWGSQFITKAQLQDASGNPQTHFGLYDDIYASWEFSTNNQKIHAGDTMEIPVPNQITIKNNILNSKTLKDKDGADIADISLNKDTRFITVTFNSTAASKSQTLNITGWISLKTNWNTNIVLPNKNTSIDWGLDDSVMKSPDTTNSATVDPPSTGQDNNSVLYKYGSFENDKINWTVEINYPGQSIPNAKYQDFIGDNQKLISDITVNSATRDADGNVTNDKENKYSDSKVTYSDDNKEFTVDFGGDIKQPINISYTTQITNYDNLSDNYSNSGDLLSNDTIKQSVTVNDSTTSIGGGASTSDILTSILGQKKWAVPEGTKIPDSIVVHLLRQVADGKTQEVTKKTVTAKDDWQYVFRYQRQYDDNGNLYHYTVKEDTPVDYVPVYDPTTYNITNYLADTFKVTKIWHDGNNAQNTRPKSIMVHLFDDKDQAKNTDSFNLNDDNNWTHTFTNLPQIAGNNWYVSEIGYDGQQTNTVPKGYIKTQYANDGNPQDQTIVNTLATSLNVTKKWDDNDSPDRPKSIQIQLYANDNNQGEKAVGSPVTLNADNNWSYSFGTNANSDDEKDPTNQLPKYDENDKEITYSAKEIDVSGYNSSTDFNDDNTQETITNKKTDPNNPSVETKTFTVNKKWSDNNNPVRPKSAQIQLLANGEKQGDPVTVNANNDWTYTWNDLDKDTTYSVKEINVDDNYVSNVDKTSDNEATITNTLKPNSGGETPSSNKKTLTVEKVWNDNNNQDKIRPSAITVYLLTNKQKTADVVLNDANNWTYTWNNLSDKNSYDVTEDKISGYTATKTTTNNKITLTNTHKLNQTGTKDPDPSTPDNPDPTPTNPDPETPSGEKDPDPDIPDTPDVPDTPKVPDTPEVGKTPDPDPVIPDNPFTPDPDPDTSTDFNPDPMVPNVPYSNSQLPQTGNKELNWLYPLIGVMILGLITFRIKKRA